VDEGIEQLLPELVQLIFEIGLGLAGDQPNARNTLGELVAGLGAAILVLLKEVSELLVVLEFLLLHRNDPGNVLLEVLKVLHQHLLLLHEL